MDKEEGNEAHAPPPRVIATVDQPPPNFFASLSSSLPPPPPAPVIRGGSRKRKLVKGRQVTDDTPPKGLDSDPPKEKNCPEPGDAGQPTSVSTSTSRSRSNAKDPAHRGAEIIKDSDEERGSLLLPRPPRRPDPESPLSDLSEPTGPGISKPITPLSGRKRLVPEVVIMTAPRKRTSSPFTGEVEERGSVDREVANGSPKGNKRQKRAVGYFDGLEDEVVVVPRKGPKGKGKAPPKGKGRAKPQPNEAVDEGEIEEIPAEDAAGTSRKVKNKVNTKTTPKRKSGRSGKSRVADPDDEVAIKEGSEVVSVDSKQVSDPPMTQQNPNVDEASPPRDAKASLGFVIDSEIVLTCDYQEDQENTPPPKPAKFKIAVTQPSIPRKLTAPSSASSFSRLNYGHSLASEEKSTSMVEIIRRANSAAGTPSVKSYSSFVKASRSVLKEIAPLHARRKTPPPLPPRPPPQKKTKKQLELEEKWEEELEETIEGWVALSSQEREVLKKQKRDMEMGFED
jgi:hypothetical protein